MDRTNRRGTRRGELLDYAPPHDIDAERAVLAVLLLDPGRIAEAAAALEKADFSDDVNRTVYEAMLRLHLAGTPIDVTLVVGELRDSGMYDAENADNGFLLRRRVERFLVSVAALATVRRDFAVQLHGMAATLEKTCPVCDKRHTFFLADLSATTAEDREYWFTCPEMVKVGIIKFDRVADVWNAVAESPNGCVRAY